MTDYVTHGGIKVAKELDDLVRDEIAPGTGVDPAKVWSLLDGIVRELGPRNRALLEKRDAFQARIDGWLGERRGKPIDPRESRAFLAEIGYLVPAGAAFKVTTANVDPEIGMLAGPRRTRDRVREPVSRRRGAARDRHVE
jgi:malate synthase